MAKDEALNIFRETVLHLLAEMRESANCTDAEIWARALSLTTQNAVQIIDLLSSE